MLNGYRVSLGTMKAVWKWVVVMKNIVNVLNAITTYI